MDFADAFVRGLLERMADQPPEALAGVTVFVNAASTRGALYRAFDRAGPLLLPQIRSITGVDPGPWSCRTRRCRPWRGGWNWRG
ncbi:hypothetical protein FLP41_04010 [Paracoccus marcusii]|uniref:hypothetical protein n=1 Tax=Paracoccus marcusii TaxID=59779 RepID=UPI002ED5AE41|nr:hypothetical protein FLP41_04010 [Paracoccus marcusii]